MESLGHRLTLCLLFREIAFPKQQHHLTFPPAMHADAISAHPCSPLLLSGGCESCLTVVVTCISLTTNGVEQLFVCLLAVYLLWTYIYSDSFAHFLIGLCVFFISPLLQIKGLRLKEAEQRAHSTTACGGTGSLTPKCCPRHHCGPPADPHLTLFPVGMFGAY